MRGGLAASTWQCTPRSWCPLVHDLSQQDDHAPSKPRCLITRGIAGFGGMELCARNSTLSISCPDAARSNQSSLLAVSKRRCASRSPSTRVPDSSKSQWRRRSSTCEAVSSLTLRVSIPNAGPRHTHTRYELRVPHCACHRGSQRNQRSDHILLRVRRIERWCASRPRLAARRWTIDASRMSLAAGREKIYRSSCHVTTPRPHCCCSPHSRLTSKQAAGSPLSSSSCSWSPFSRLLHLARHEDCKSVTRQRCLWHRSAPSNGVRNPRDRVSHLPTLSIPSALGPFPRSEQGWARLDWFPWRCTQPPLCCPASHEQ